MTPQYDVRLIPCPTCHKRRARNEVDSMLEMRVVRLPTSLYPSPIVMVKNKDGSNRVGIDCRKAKFTSGGEGGRKFGRERQESLLERFLPPDAQYNKENGYILTYFKRDFSE